MNGKPCPDIRLGALVIDEDLHPCLVMDDEVRRPVRRVMRGEMCDVWVSSLIQVDAEEFELALILEVLDASDRS